MKTLFLAVTMTLTVIVITLFGAPPQNEVVAGQYTAPNTTTYCTTSSYADTDMVVSLTTTGNPIAISFNAAVNLSTNQGIGLRATIDGNVPDIASSVHYVGAGELMTLSFSRIYSLPKGNHTFKVQSACQGSVGLGLRWLSVYELN